MEALVCGSACPMRSYKCIGKRYMVRALPTPSSSTDPATSCLFELRAHRFFLAVVGVYSEFDEDVKSMVQVWPEFHLEEDLHKQAMLKKSQGET
jgi:hypothetical protein